MVNVKAVGEKYRCNVCGNEVEVTKAGGGELVCCGQAMVPVEAAAPEGAPPAPVEEAPAEEVAEEAPAEETAPEGEAPEAPAAPEEQSPEGEGSGV